MKKILLLLFLFAALYCKAQFPNTVTSGNTSTLQKANGAYGAMIGFVFAGTYGDTTAANLSFIKNVPGIVIRIADELWIRNNAATAWNKIGSGVGAWGSITGTLSAQTDLQNALNGKETSFTETAEEFTGSTSMSITLSNTPKSGKAEMYFLNGVAINQSNISRTGTGVTLSGFTRWSSDVITAKYSY